MTALTIVAWLAVMGVMAGGYMAGAGLTSGLLLAAICSITLGVLFAAAQRGLYAEGFEVDDAFTVQQLREMTATLDPATPVCIAAEEPGVGAAGGIFTAWLNGRNVLVIERQEEQRG